MHICSQNHLFRMAELWNFALTWASLSFSIEVFSLCSPLNLRDLSRRDRIRRSPRYYMWTKGSEQQKCNLPKKKASTFKNSKCIFGRTSFNAVPFFLGSEFFLIKIKTFNRRQEKKELRSNDEINILSKFLHSPSLSLSRSLSVWVENMHIWILITFSSISRNSYGYFVWKKARTKNAWCVLLGDGKRETELCY